MKKEVAEAWVSALRSGKYSKTTRQLRTSQGFCCLGVLCDISGQGSWYEDHKDSFVYRDIHKERGHIGLHATRAALTDTVKEWAGLKTGIIPYIMLDTDKDNGSRTALSGLNDAGMSFDDISRFIEQNWENL